MFEVKVNIVHGNLTIPVTIATFEPGTSGRSHGGVYVTPQEVARNRALFFAKQIDKGYAVEVVNTEDEDNCEKAFGLVYHHDADI